MLVRFLVCLAPAFLAFLVTLAFSLVTPADNGDLLMWILIVLVSIGAILSGTLVGRKIIHSMKGSAAGGWALAIVSFICIAIAYVGISAAGCCCIAVFSTGLA